MNPEVQLSQPHVMIVAPPGNSLIRKSSNRKEVLSKNRNSEVIYPLPKQKTQDQEQKASDVAIKQYQNEKFQEIQQTKQTGAKLGRVAQLKQRLQRQKSLKKVLIRYRQQNITLGGIVGSRLKTKINNQTIIKRAQNQADTQTSIYNDSTKIRHLRQNPIFGDASELINIKAIPPSPKIQIITDKRAKKGAAALVDNQKFTINNVAKLQKINSKKLSQQFKGANLNNFQDVYSSFDSQQTKQYLIMNKNKYKVKLDNSLRKSGNSSLPKSQHSGDVKSIRSGKKPEYSRHNSIDNIKFQDLKITEEISPRQRTERVTQQSNNESSSINRQNIVNKNEEFHLPKIQNRHQQPSGIYDLKKAIKSQLYNKISANVGQNQQDRVLARLVSKPNRRIFKNRLANRSDISQRRISAPNMPLMNESRQGDKQQKQQNKEKQELNVKGKELYKRNKEENSVATKMSRSSSQDKISHALKMKFKHQSVNNGGNRSIENVNKTKKKNNFDISIIMKKSQSPLNSKIRESVLRQELPSQTTPLPIQQQHEQHNQTKFKTIVQDSPKPFQTIEYHHTNESSSSNNKQSLQKQLSINTLSNEISQTHSYITTPSQSKFDHNSQLLFPNDNNNNSLIVKNSSVIVEQQVQKAPIKIPTSTIKYITQTTPKISLYQPSTIAIDHSSFKKGPALAKKQMANKPQLNNLSNTLKIYQQEPRKGNKSLVNKLQENKQKSSNFIRQVDQSSLNRSPHHQKHQHIFRHHHANQLKTLGYNELIKRISQINVLDKGNNKSVPLDQYLLQIPSHSPSTKQQQQQQLRIRSLNASPSPPALRQPRHSKMSLISLKKSSRQQNKQRHSNSIGVGTTGGTQTPTDYLDLQQEGGDGYYYDALLNHKKHSSPSPELLSSSIIEGAKIRRNSYNSGNVSCSINRRELIDNNKYNNSIILINQQQFSTSSTIQAIEQIKRSWESVQSFKEEMMKKQEQIKIKQQQLEINKKLNRDTTMSKKRLLPVVNQQHAVGGGIRFLSIKKANRVQLKSNIQPIRGNNFPTTLHQKAEKISQLIERRASQPERKQQHMIQLDEQQYQSKNPYYYNNNNHNNHNRKFSDDYNSALMNNQDSCIITSRRDSHNNKISTNHYMSSRREKNDQDRITPLKSYRNGVRSYKSLLMIKNTPKNSASNGSRNMNLLQVSQKQVHSNKYNRVIKTQKSNNLRQEAGVGTHDWEGTLLLNAQQARMRGSMEQTKQSNLGKQRSPSKNKNNNNSNIEPILPNFKIEIVKRISKE